LSSNVSQGDLASIASAIANISAIIQAMLAK
jgi:hypothetical protein